jgi:hypothetical protein
VVGAVAILPLTSRGAHALEAEMPVTADAS